MEEKMGKLRQKIQGSIQIKLLLAFLIMVLILALVITLCAYMLLTNLARTQINETFSLYLNNIEDNLEREIGMVLNLSDFLFTNDTVKLAVESAGDATNEALQASQSAYAQIQQYIFSNCRDSINSVSIYGNNSYNINCNISYVGSLTDQPVSLDSVKAHAEKSNGVSVWGEYRQRPLFPQNENSITIPEIPLVRTLKNRRYREDIGYIFISMAPEVLSRHLRLNSERISTAGLDYQVYLLDDKGQFVYASDDTLINEEIAEIAKMSNAQDVDELAISSTSRTSFARRLPSTNWTLIGMMAYPSIWNQGSYIPIMILLALGLSGLVCFLTYLYISKGLFQRIRGLSRAVVDFPSSGHQRFKPVAADEIGHLALNLNQMLSEIEALNRQNMEKERRMRSALYRARQSQMNPHFTYNTLNSIRWMAEMEDHKSIIQSVKAFWRISKYASDLSQYCVSVRDEVAIAREYVRLQEFSYPGRALVFWNVDKEALDCECVKFLLQPIIENAILHGILPKGKTCEIYINIFLEDGRLIFNVHDLGVGMEETKMSELLEKRTDDDRMALGLRNVFERLWSIYGEAAVDIEIDTQLGGYTDITIRQPCVQTANKSAVIL